jgi:hypothetical protein
VGGLCNWDYCVFCGIQTVCLKAYLKAFVMSATACSMAWVVSYWPLTMEAQIWFWVSPCKAWWIKRYWDRFLSQYFHYPISVSFLQCCILIIILIELKREYSYEALSHETYRYALRCYGILVRKCFHFIFCAWKNEIVLLWSG